MKTCKIHNVKFSDKSPNSQGKYWHVIDFAKKEFCSITKEEYDALPEDGGGVEEKADWDAKDRQSMAQTAMKSASEIVAALIKVDGVWNIDLAQQAVKDMANEFYKELKKMKSEV